jgi:hypothetical protein
MSDTNTVPANSAAIPIRMGIIIAAISVILFTICNMFLISNLIVYFISVFLCFVIQVVLMGVTGAQQRKAIGGYISFKDAFRAIFIAVLIFVIINTIYSYIYMHFIDADFSTKMKDASLKFAEKMGATQDKLDLAAKQADEKLEQSKHLSSQLLSFFWSLVIYSIFGFTCAAIVKKNKPENQQML